MKSNSKEKILVTGCAGFIGMHTVLSLLNDDIIVHGIDNLNAYYDVNLKKNRLKILKDYKTFSFSKTEWSILKEGICSKILFTKI